MNPRNVVPFVLLSHCIKHMVSILRLQIATPVPATTTALHTIERRRIEKDPTLPFVGNSWNIYLLPFLVWLQGLLLASTVARLHVRINRVNIIKGGFCF